MSSSFESPDGENVRDKTVRLVQDAIRDGRAGSCFPRSGVKRLARLGVHPVPDATGATVVEWPQGRRRVAARQSSLSGARKMSDAVAASEFGKVARQGGLGNQHGHDLRFRADVHGLRDGAVLDALEDAAPKIGVVGIAGFDLEDDGQGPAVIDDVDPVRGVQKYFGVGIEVPVAPANPARIVPDPKAESPVVPSLAAPSVADAVAFGALRRDGGPKTLAESLTVDLVPLAEGIDVGRDLFAGGAPSTRVPVSVAVPCQLGVGPDSRP